MKTKQLFLLFFLVYLFGCSGGGGGSNAAAPSVHVPSISNLELSPEEVNLNRDGGHTTISVSFNFVDNGGDLSFITVTAYDALGNNLGSSNSQISGADGMTSGIIQGTMNLSTGTIAVYTFEFSLTDKAGKQSNKMSAEFSVMGPVSIAVTPTNTIIANGMTRQFTATGTFQDSSTIDLTTQVVWSSLDTNKATINSGGLATGKVPGSTTISAVFGDISGSTSLKIMQGFAASVNYTSPSNYLADTAIGDLNGDGRNDVAVLADGRMFIYYQNSQGTLESAQGINTDLSLQGIVIADVNNDGFADLIVSGTYYKNNGTDSEGRIYVYLQNQTTHTLGSAQQYTLSSKRVGPLAVADLNDDGLLDIIVAGTDASSNGILSFLFQSAGGVLGPEVTYTNVPVYIGGQIHVGDMNSDGLNDIVLQSGALQLAVIKQTTPGVFSTTPDFYAVQTSYWSEFKSFALGDLNGDGLTDIVVGDPANNPILNIFYQNSGGTLDRFTSGQFSVNSHDEVHIADLNGDGLNDIIILCSVNKVNIYYQAADHSFYNVITYTVPGFGIGGTFVHQALSVGDLTGDGLLDIVTSAQSEGIVVLMQLP